MKFRLLLSIFFLLFVVAADAQDIVFGYAFGLGSYQMRDMKRVQTQALNDINAIYHDVKTTEDFPGWIFQNLFAGYKFGASEVGLRYDHFATSGRNHLSDYSGSYRHDTHVKGNSLGGYYKVYFVNVPIKESFHFDVNFSISAGFIFNKYQSETILEIYDTPSLDQYALVEHRSTNFFFLPSFTPTIWFKEYVGLNVSIGYQIDIQGTAFFGLSGNSVGINWTGARFSFGLSGKIPVKNLKK